MRRIMTLLLLSSALLSGCGSSPAIRYYVLQPTATETTQPFSGAIGIGPVAVAEYLNENTIVISDDGYRLSSAVLDQWGEPLADGIARVITENLAVLTGSDKVRTFPWRGDEQPEVALKIDVLALNASDNVATLRLRWALRKTGLPQPLDEGFARYQHTLSSMRYADIARAYSDLLEQFSRDMAKKLDADKINVD